MAVLCIECAPGKICGDAGFLASVALEYGCLALCLCKLHHRWRQFLVSSLQNGVGSHISELRVCLVSELATCKQGVDYMLDKFGCPSRLLKG